jgi:hypothetical protein
MDSNSRSPVKKNLLVETVLFDLSSTSLSRGPEEGVWPAPNLAHYENVRWWGSPEENSADLDQA